MSKERQRLIRGQTLALEDTIQRMGQKTKQLQDSLDVVGTILAPATPPQSLAELARAPRPAQTATGISDKAACTSPSRIEGEMMTKGGRGCRTHQRNMQRRE